MNSDIRISVTFKDHRKRKKLAHRLGCEAVLALLDLWLAAAETKPSGVLTGMDVEDIAIDAGWGGDAAEFVETLCDVGFLDCNEGVYSLHDWEEHNSYAAAAPARSAKAQKAARARWGDRLNNAPSNAPSKNEQSKGKGEHGSSFAPSPSPSPSPSPKDKEGGDDTPPAKKKGKDDPYAEQAKEVLAYLNEKTGKKLTSVGKIPARLNEGRTVDECKRVIDIKVADRNFDRKWLDHTTLFRPDNFDKYLNQGADCAQGGLTYDDAANAHDRWADPHCNRFAGGQDDDGQLPEARAVSG